MPANSPNWNELRQFWSCEPSELAFRALGGLLESWSGPDSAEARNFAAEILADWPDATRSAAWSWCKAAARGQLLCAWPLVRALHLKPSHLSKGTVELAQLAANADLSQITELTVPADSDFRELSFLYHYPEMFPRLKKLCVRDKRDDGAACALTRSPLWRTLEHFEIDPLSESLAHRRDVSRIVPEPGRDSPLRHLQLRAFDLISLWDRQPLPGLRSAAVFIRSVREAELLARRRELDQLESLSIAFRCGFNGSGSFHPVRGNIIQVDEVACETFFRTAGLRSLQHLTIVGYSTGYWSREGLGSAGLQALIASGLLKQLTHLRLEMLPLGDEGAQLLAPAMGPNLESLELIDVWCGSIGAESLAASPCMNSLRHLNLSGNRMEADTAATIAKAFLPNLESLDLSGPGIHPYYWNTGEQPILDAAVAAWSASPNVRRLRRLNVSNCFLTDGALRTIFGSSNFAHLEQLDLSHSEFSAAAVASVVDSPLWLILRGISLKNCRLDDAAAAALTQVKKAPLLRSLDLAYNSIGARGTAALSGWSVLENVWWLNLHDNVLGDNGLIALASSPYLGRLVELDLEQDCWNSRATTFGDAAAEALAGARTLSRLDSLFAGRVDEYHGSAISPGFSKAALKRLQQADWMSPACRASCSDFTGIGTNYYEFQTANPEAELDDHDFRKHSRQRTVIPNDNGCQGPQIQQLRTFELSDSSGTDEDFLKSSVSQLPEVCSQEEARTLRSRWTGDVLEGIECVDPKFVVQHPQELSLSLKDPIRPLPSQAGKVIRDTLESFLNSTLSGYCESCGGTSRNDAQGRLVAETTHLSLGISCNHMLASRVIREVLWWIGAPANTQWDGHELSENPDAASLPATTFVQLTAPTVVRWGRVPYYRIDRVPFPPVLRTQIAAILQKLDAVPAANEWREIAVPDGGRLSICARYLEVSDRFDALNILIETLSLDVSRLIYRLMQACELTAFPMLLAPSDEVASRLNCGWPRPDALTSDTQLHSILTTGPFRTWSDYPKNRSDTASGTD